MGLIFSGMCTSDGEWTTCRASDAATGEKVIVKITDIVIQDHGLQTGQGKAQQKYAAGQISRVGGVIQVTVTSADF